MSCARAPTAAQHRLRPAAPDDPDASPALVERAAADGTGASRRAGTARLLNTLRDVRAVVADAVQLGRCTVRELGDELACGPVKGSAMFRSVLAEVADGIRSTAEGDLRDVIRVNRLPMPLFNPSLYLGIFNGGGAGRGRLLMSLRAAPRVRDSRCPGASSPAWALPLTT